MIDIDSPIQVSSGAGSAEPNADQVASLADMGFTNAQAKKALRETVRIFPFFFCIGRRILILTL